MGVAVKNRGWWAGPTGPPPSPAQGWQSLNEPTTQQLKSSRSHEPQTTRLQRFNQVCQTKFKSYKTEVCQTGKKLSNYKRQSLPLSCSGSKPTWSAFNFIADHKRKIMICIPPKTGCTIGSFILYAFSRDWPEYVSNVLEIIWTTEKRKKPKILVDFLG